MVSAASCMLGPGGLYDLIFADSWVRLGPVRNMATIRGRPPVSSHADFGNKDGRVGVQGNLKAIGIEFGAHALKERLDVNTRWGSASLNDWILSLINLKSGESVLDVACGYGQTAILYKDAVGPTGRVVGTDLSPDLIQEAKGRAGIVDGLRFLVHDAAEPFPFESNSFDAITCNFAIYHFPDLDRPMTEFHRMLKHGGRLLITGPHPSNNHFVYQIHDMAGGRIRVDMPRKTFKRRTEESLRGLFPRYRYHLFRNIVTFPDIDAFIGYYSKTMLFLANADPPEREVILARSRGILKHFPRIQNEKVVGGFLAWRS